MVTTAPQPTLRPYIVYDRLPAGHVAHVMRERTCPVLRCGETLVVDPADRTIATGDLFVMESGRANPNGPTRNVVEFNQRTYCIYDPGAREGRDQPCWQALFYSETFRLDGSDRKPIRFMDGPVTLDNAAYFEDRIVGRVVGILEATFAEPTRLAA